jgi:hypothetical protein
MAKFGIVNDNEELGGLSTELVGRTVAYQELGEYTTPSKFEQGKVDTVLRTRAFAAAKDGSLEDLGIRLIFWPVAQRQMREQWAANDFAVGVLHEQPQANDPSRTFYSLGTPEPSEVERLIAAFGE